MLWPPVNQQTSFSKIYEWSARQYVPLPAYGHLKLLSDGVTALSQHQDASLLVANVIVPQSLHKHDASGEPLGDWVQSWTDLMSVSGPVAASRTTCRAASRSGGRFVMMS